MKCTLFLGLQFKGVEWQLHMMPLPGRPFLIAVSPLRSGFGVSNIIRGIQLEIVGCSTFNPALRRLGLTRNRQLTHPPMRQLTLQVWVAVGSPATRNRLLGSYYLVNDGGRSSCNHRLLVPPGCRA